LVRLKSQKSLKGYRSSIKNNTLYLFLTGASVDPLIDKAKPSGLIKKVNRKDVSGNIQLEFELKDGFTSHETFQDVESNDILISIQSKMFDVPKIDLTTKKEEWKFDVVVIDAGHGGKDPGAIGVGGTREKDVNLGIALKLGKLIEKKLPGVKVVYTRNNDTFVELYKRGKIANEANGKLFISIHCNSLSKKPSDTRGFEVYLLRPGRTKRAIEIAEFENSVIHYEENPDRYQALTDENFILVSMAHSSYMRYSEKFSDILNHQWSRHTKIPSRGIKQAGFYVLVGASMPSVLIETGFLSNRQDEAYLKSSIGQQEIANAILNSIASYKEFYDKAFVEASN
jgi:N-acetylmuramoyl-L-alanine amidase